MEHEVRTQMKHYSPWTGRAGTSIQRLVQLTRAAHTRGCLMVQIRLHRAAIEEGTGLDVINVMTLTLEANELK